MTAAATPREVTEDQFALLCAWLLVIDRVSNEDARLLALLALKDFAGRRCVDCVPCNGSSAPLTLTAAVAHRRNAAGRAHHLTLNESTLRVMP